MIARIMGLFRFRAVRFLFSGGVGFVTVMSILYVLTDIFEMWYLFSFVLAFLVGQTVSFTLQKFFTFSDSTLGVRRVSGQATAFVSLGVFNLAANSALLYAAVEYADLHYLVAQFVISLIIAVWSFVCFRMIFKSAEPSVSPTPTS